MNEGRKKWEEGRVAAASGRRAADEHKQLAAREEEDAERAKRVCERETSLSFFSLSKEGGKSFSSFAALFFSLAKGKIQNKKTQGRFGAGHHCRGD